ncbi:MAG: hypothetical protein IJ155_10385 [Prevotella sp.]|nr:hypothetical protein [Prevotella sp.]
MKNKNLLNLSKSLPCKLLLTLALVIGWGSSAWADNYTTTLTFDNSTIPTGWTNGGQFGNTTYTAFSLNNGYIECSNTYGQHSLTSESTTLSLSSGQTIIITAKVKSGYSSNYQHVTIKYNNNGSSTYTELKKFGNTDYSSQSEYTQLAYTLTGNYSSCRLQFVSQASVISKIEVKAPIPDLTTIDEAINPGVFRSSTVSSLTVKYTANAGWNTICMPIQLRTYSVNYINSLFGSDWKAYTLSGYESNTLTFSEIGSSGYVNANTPLLVYAPNATGNQAQLEIGSTNVTYSASPTATSGDAIFQGTYAPITAGNFTSSMYGVTSNGQVRPGDGENANIKGYRAYFTGVSAPADGARISIVIEGDEDPTDVGFVRMVDPEAKEVYTLSGQKVEKAGKGIYIVNGRKVVIK